MHKHGGDVYTNKGIIDYSSNVNYRGIPEAVKKAAKEAVDLCVNYPDVEDRELIAAIAAKDRIAADTVFCGNGAAEVIYILAAAVKPKKALLPAPTFYEYEGALRAQGCEIEYYYLREEDDFVPDMGFAAAIDEDTDIVFLCVPNNPTGSLIPKEEILKILEQCRRFGALLVVDECFNEFLQAPAAYSVLNEAAGSEGLFVLKSFTKMFAMPGLRLGYGVSGDKALLSRMAEVSQPWRVSLPAQAAGAAACRETEFCEESRARTLAEKKRFRAALKDLGFEIFGSEANYIFFKADPLFGERMLEKGYLLRDCGNYEGLEKGWFRAAVRSPGDNDGFIRAAKEVTEGR